MEHNSIIMITGSAGMVGKRLVKRLSELGYRNLVCVTRSMCDLRNGEAVEKLFETTKPNYVFHIAAVVGGIAANINHPVQFLADNLLMNTHVLLACQRHKVTKTLFLGSSCIYPRNCSQPMEEESLMTGTLEPTNEGYALSKISGLVLCKALHAQYNMSVVCPMPCNIYGPGDHFDLSKSHVLSALVKRMEDARKSNAEKVVLWGTGSARREFIHVDDVVDGMLFLISPGAENVGPAHINLGPGEDISIRDLAYLIKSLCNYEGEIEWDATKPDGMPRKCMNVQKLNSLGYSTKISLEEGIKQVILEYRSILEAA